MWFLLSLLLFMNPDAQLSCWTYLNCLTVSSCWPMFKKWSFLVYCLTGKVLHLAVSTVEIYLPHFTELNSSFTEGSSVFEQCGAQPPALLWATEELQSDDNSLCLRAWPLNPGMIISLLSTYSHKTDFTSLFNFPANPSANRDCSCNDLNGI